MREKIHILEHISKVKLYFGYGVGFVGDSSYAARKLPQSQGEIDVSEIRQKGIAAKVGSVMTSIIVSCVMTQSI